MNMKIEKLNENQIRCTLTRADLAERQLQLSELAYGTEKAKSLFHDMMQQAAFEFGFEAEDIPLMIEAIPASSDSIVLIITKVEDPEELDTRFSKFAPSPGGDSDQRKKDALQKLEGAETLLNLLGKVKEKINAADTANNSMEKDAPEGTQSGSPPVLVSNDGQRPPGSTSSRARCTRVPIPCIRTTKKTFISWR